MIGNLRKGENREGDGSGRWSTNELGVRNALRGLISLGRRGAEGL